MNETGTNSHPYDALTPDVVLDAIDSVATSLGLRADGRLIALNSYENRVYQVWLNNETETNQTRMIAKFYRPGRWTDAAILEEHQFGFELASHEIPIIAPQVLKAQSLHQWRGFRFSVSKHIFGRAPELDQRDTLEWMGRFLGRIHAVGATKAFDHRIVCDLKNYGQDPTNFILENHFVPAALLPAYQAIVSQALGAIAAAFERAGDIRRIRLHGDCHVGNVLWHQGPQFVDLDDCCMGPALQDLWMLLSGSRDAQQTQLNAVLSGYEDFMPFDPRELNFLEALRTLRLLHMSGWIAKRWADPAFPRAFPWFGTERYWQDRILELREQIALMSEPPLVA